MAANDLAQIWFYLLSFFLFLYIVFDGFDLGIGIMALFSRDEGFFEAGAEILHGVWHANQTWIIVFAAGLLGAFPLVYAAITAALYIPAGPDAVEPDGPRRHLGIPLPVSRKFPPGHVYLWFGQSDGGRDSGSGRWHSTVRPADCE